MSNHFLMSIILILLFNSVMKSRGLSIWAEILNANPLQSMCQEKVT